MKMRERERERERQKKRRRRKKYGCAREMPLPTNTKGMLLATKQKKSASLASP